MGHSLIHANNNLICVADIFTTGIDANRDSLLEFCIIPLNSFYEVYKQDLHDLKETQRTITPFNIEITPNRPENIKIRNRAWIKTLPRGVNRERILHITTHGIDQFKAADYLDVWFQNLKLPWKKKISLITYDWIYKHPFMLNWLGPETYYQFFDTRYRDIVTSSLFANDRADMRNNEIPFPKNFLTYLCSQLKIEYTRGQDLVTNCSCIAQIYKSMLTYSEVPI